jgi:hypothetical protein
MRPAVSTALARFFITIILGLVAGFAFMWQSTRLAVLFFAARWMDRKRIGGLRCQHGCSTERHVRTSFWQLSRLLENPFCSASSTDGVYVISGNHEYIFGYSTWMAYFAEFLRFHSDDASKAPDCPSWWHGTRRSHIERRWIRTSCVDVVYTKIKCGGNLGVLGAGKRHHPIPTRSPPPTAKTRNLSSRSVNRRGAPDADPHAKRLIHLAVEGQIAIRFTDNLWKAYYTPADDIGRLIPQSKMKSSGKRNLVLVDRNGVRHECVAESFTQTTPGICADPFGGEH